MQVVVGVIFGVGFSAIGFFFEKVSSEYHSLEHFSGEGVLFSQNTN